MLAVERTTKLFVKSLKEADIDVNVSVVRSRTSWGRSNYVYIRAAREAYTWKVRISDHAIGMKRALNGCEDAYISAGSRPASWSIWISQLVRELGSMESNLQ